MAYARRKFYELHIKHSSLIAHNARDYYLKRCLALTRYLNGDSLSVESNWAENQMRPWALGRNNWLFAGYLRSGQRSVNIMSPVLPVVQ